MKSKVKSFIQTPESWYEGLRRPEEFLQQVDDLITQLNRRYVVGFNCAGLRHSPGGGMIRRGVDPPADVARRFREALLAFLGEQPVDVHLGRVRMGGPIEEAEGPIRGAHIASLAQSPDVHDLDGHALADTLLGDGVRC